jgi:hypothetical protein
MRAMLETSICKRALLSKRFVARLYLLLLIVSWRSVLDAVSLLLDNLYQEKTDFTTDECCVFSSHRPIAFESQINAKRGQKAFNPTTGESRQPLYWIK